VVESIDTQDPRVADLLEHRGELNPDGEPTRLAAVAEKVLRRLDDVEHLRVELSKATREAQELDAQVAAREAYAGAGDKHRGVLVDQMVDVRARAALSSSSSGGSANLRRQYRDAKTRLEEYDRDTGEDGARLEAMRQAARDKTRQVKQIRESISRHLGVLDSLLDGVDTAMPTGNGAGAPTMSRARRPGRRVVRRVRRRR